ncbi:probable lysophospholipase BODYGUARD 4 [Typha angustifolia]|uniref:probable lysophospholipase BODYGUARD 4 n=1 Tax=Typha angustifolia TaxID=59011 RepID=UPI003C2B5E60
MLRVAKLSLQKWPGRALDALNSAISGIVFALLDLLDFILCFFYRFVDGVLEENPIPCYCYHNRGKQGILDVEEEEEEVSETLYERRNFFRQMDLLSLKERSHGGGEGGGGGKLRSSRWSDCGCESCVSWQGKGEEKLHLVVREPSQARSISQNVSPENVVFIHGFLSSSSFWTQTVFPYLSEATTLHFRMFALDLLGFGRSPKPLNCLYRVKEHREMIETSVIEQFRLKSFHIVAHSMGCIIALALASKYPESVKSITLVAPPYFPSNEMKQCYTPLNKLAGRKVWPPLLLASSIMSWYEHLGRTVCFLFCRNHLIWEWIIGSITRRRDLNFLVRDMTQHTHHSAWHTMHNVICGGAKLQDKYLEVVKRAGISLRIIHGDKDQVVPVECSHNMKSKVPFADLQILNDADHNTVIVGREKSFSRDLEKFWLYSGI